MKIKDVHELTIAQYGETANINKAIQEFNELIEVLRDHKHGKTCINEIKEEIADCLNMIDKLCVLFDFRPVDINVIKHTKMLRTLRRLENDKKGHP